jgi:hypothetical protein
MNGKPGIINIIQNDSWAAPVLGVFIMSLSMTTIVLLTDQMVGNLKAVNIPTFIWMTGISFFASIFTSIQRIRYVNKVFENGLMLKAQVIESSHYKSTLQMKLRYTYLTQTHEKKLKQVITGKTKKLIDQKEVTLVIDQNNPDHILLRDVYW